MNVTKQILKMLALAGVFCSVMSACSSQGVRYVVKEGDHVYSSRPETAVAFQSNGKVSSFEASVSVPEPVNVNASRVKKPAVYFRVWADKTVVWTSGLICSGDNPVDVSVNLSGAKEIVLETVSSGPWHPFIDSRGDWSGARFNCEKGARLRKLEDPALFTQLGILTPAVKPEPCFNGADIWGVRPGHPVIFRIPVSGERPMKFTADNLPEGVTLDADKGILGGIAPAAGNYDILVTAENARGKASREIRLAVGDVIALTPPMGWNSWNIWGYGLTDERARASALAMENSGLGDFGWAYVNLDDWWEMNNSDTPRVKIRAEELGHEDVIGPARDASGKINTNRSFPDMNALTDYIHSFGFKAGLYSSPGFQTCGLCEGSLGHELQDAESWADWGFDYIKYDWCSYGKVFNPIIREHPEREREEAVRPYKLMYECLKKQDRDILFSYCQYGKWNVHEWAREYGANCWRSWEDLKDGWHWMELAVESRINAEYCKYSGPGCWADPDMMIVGDQRSFGTTHPTCLTPNEQYTHVSIWAMIGAPLLIGCDLTKLDDFTMSLLTNREVLAISQDRLGKVARRYRHNDLESVWARPLDNGDWAIALVNRYPLTREIKVDFSELGLEGEFKVKDCWSGQNEGRASGHIAAEVPPHATKLVRISGVDCHRCDD